MRMRSDTCVLARVKKKKKKKAVIIYAATSYITRGKGISTCRLLGSVSEQHYLLTTHTHAYIRPRTHIYIYIHFILVEQQLLKCRLDLIVIIIIANSMSNCASIIVGWTDRRILINGIIYSLP